jgi:hypothetical protein
MGCRKRVGQLACRPALGRAFDAMTRERTDALLVLSDSFTTFYRARLAELAAKLPAIYGHAQYIEAGG